MGKAGEAQQDSPKNRGEGHAVTVGYGGDGGVRLYLKHDEPVLLAA